MGSLPSFALQRLHLGQGPSRIAGLALKRAHHYGVDSGKVMQELGNAQIPRQFILNDNPQGQLFAMGEPTALQPHFSLYEIGPGGHVNPKVIHFQTDGSRLERQEMVNAEEQQTLFELAIRMAQKAGFDPSPTLVAIRRASTNNPFFYPYRDINF